jgi:ATP-dependent DNA ligase
LDGELMYSLEGVDVDRKTASGIINKAIKGTISAEESKGLNLVCWDMIPYEYFIQGDCPIKYLDRFLQLRLTISDSTSHIKIVDSKTVFCKEDAIQQYKNNLQKGLEGCILKNMDAIWSSKRSNDYLKLKNESSADLLVVGFEYGSKGSQFESMLGALICETSDGLLQVNVGSGFKHTLGERDNPESYVGKIVEVKYNEVISNKTSDKKSLFLPIYVCVRSDKDVANSLEQLM